jgi:hypothetical protein
MLGNEKFSKSNKKLLDQVEERILGIEGNVELSHSDRNKDYDHNI